jgi:hypothetical protein
VYARDCLADNRGEVGVIPDNGFTRSGEVNDADPSELTVTGLQWPSYAPVLPTNARIPTSTTDDADWSHFQSKLHPHNCDLDNGPNIDFTQLT